jgi:hypothetical protein
MLQNWVVVFDLCLFEAPYTHAKQGIEIDFEIKDARGNSKLDFTNQFRLVILVRRTCYLRRKIAGS